MKTILKVVAILLLLFLLFQGCYKHEKDSDKFVHNKSTTEAQLKLIQSIEIQNLFNPTSAITDSDGNYYFLDLSDNLIKLYTKDGTFVKEFGGKGEGPGEFISPSDLCMNKEETLLAIKDNDAKRISIFEKDGTFKSSFIISGIGPWNAKLHFIGDSLLVGGSYIPQSPDDFDTMEEYYKAHKYLNIFSLEGNYLKSFYDLSKTASQYYVHSFEGAYSDVANDRIYVIQPTEYTISTFSLEGESLGDFPIQSTPEFKKITTPQPDVKKSGLGKLESWIHSWSNINDLFLVNTEYLVIKWLEIIEQGDENQIIIHHDLINRDTMSIEGSLSTENFFPIIDTKSERLYTFDDANANTTNITMNIYSIDDFIGLFK